MTSNETTDDVLAGQAVYSPSVLKTYDLMVLGISNRLIWKCPTKHLLAMYDEHVSGHHLDVGVGTGYFLDHCKFPNENPRVTLLDLNANCLEQTAARIARYRPEMLRANLLEPIEYDGERFASIGMNYVLHCLPGDLGTKAVVFDHLGLLLQPGGVVFGSTLLTDGVRRGFLARRLMGAYNRKRIFSNGNDSLEQLEQELSNRFPDFGIDTVGCVALFWARSPR